MTNTRASELQSYKSYKCFRASKAELRTQRYENTEHCESQLKAIFDTFRKSYGEQRQNPGQECRNLQRC